MFNNQLETWRFGIKFKPVKELLKIASAEGAVQAKLPPPPAPAAVQPQKPPAVKPGLSSHIAGKTTASREGVAAGNSPYATVISPPKPNNTSYISAQAPPAPTAPPRPVTPPVTPPRPAAVPVQTPVPQNTQPTKPVPAPNVQNIQTSAAPQQSTTPVQPQVQSQLGPKFNQQGNVPTTPSVPSVYPQQQTNTQSYGQTQGMTPGHQKTLSELPSGTKYLGDNTYDVPGYGHFIYDHVTGTGRLVNKPLTPEQKYRQIQNDNKIEYQAQVLRNAGTSADPQMQAQIAAYNARVKAIQRGHTY